MRESVGDRPDVLGDLWVCEESASGFVQTHNELVNGCVSGIGFYSVLIDLY